MSYATLKALTKQLESHHSPSVRAVVDFLEKVIAERDAIEFKYIKALERIIELERQLYELRNTEN